MIPGLVWMALAAATAAPPVETPPLMEAEAALRAGIHGKCIELARDAVKSGRLEPAALARAWLVRGRCHILDGDADKAARAYAVAVRVDPELILPTDDAVFARVRPEGRGASSSLTLIARAVVLGEGAAPGTVVGIDALVQDDLGISASVVLIDEDDREVAAAPVSGPTTGLVRVHRLSGFPVEGLRARLLDKAGNRLRVVDVEFGDEARRALGVAGATITQTTSPRPVGTLAYVGAGVLGAGFALATVMGIQSAVALQADDSRVVDDELPLLLGFGGGVLGFVVGGALVVAERLQAAPTAAEPATAAAPATKSDAAAPVADVADVPVPATDPAPTAPATDGSAP